jgi:hypothetical protein
MKMSISSAGQSTLKHLPGRFFDGLDRVQDTTGNSQFQKPGSMYEFEDDVGLETRDFRRIC